MARFRAVSCDFVDRHQAFALMGLALECAVKPRRQFFRNGWVFHVQLVFKVNSKTT